MLLSVKNVLVKKEMWGGALSWCNSLFFCRQSSGRSLCIFSCSRGKTSQWYVDLTDRPISTNSLWITPLMSKWWACSWLSSSPDSPFSVSVSLNFPCTAHTLFPERLSNHWQGLRRTFSEICSKSDAVPSSDLSLNHHQARYTTPNKRT
jgi:hypothetical protein